MAHFKKVGSWSAIICAATYLFGIVIMVAFLEPAGFGSRHETGADLVAFLRQKQTVLSIWYLVIYVVNAIALAALVIALKQVLAEKNPVFAQLSGGFGLIWAALVLGAGMVANVGLAAAVASADVTEAARLWAVVSVIENGLGGGNEIAGSVWVITVSLAALGAGAFSRPLIWLGFVIGGCGLLTIIPPLEAFGMIFGLGFIVWFAWVGIALRK